jgi:hypothetical protein
MSSPLVDPEGFPRADIDVYAVRHARAALVRLRNDHRAVVEEMGRVLQVVYAAPEGQEVAAVVRTEGGAVERRSVNGTGRVQVALAKVNAVAPGSPAAQAVRSHESLLSPVSYSFCRREWSGTTSSSNSGIWTGTTRWRTLGRSWRLPKGYILRSTTQGRLDVDDVFRA